MKQLLLGLEQQAAMRNGITRKALLYPGYMPEALPCTTQR